MKEHLKPLAAQLIALNPEDRAELLRGVLGSGLVEAPEIADDGITRYKIQNVYVDQDTYDLVKNDFGIFDVKQTGLSPDTALDALDAQAENKRVSDHLNAVLGQMDRGYSMEYHLRDELREIGKMVGVKFDKWQTPNSADIWCAIVAGGFKGGQAPAAMGMPSGFESFDSSGQQAGDTFVRPFTADADLDRQLTIAEAAAGVGTGVPIAEQSNESHVIGIFLDQVGPHYNNGDPPEIIAKEFSSDLRSLGGEHLVQVAIKILRETPKARILTQASSHQDFNAYGQEWLETLLVALAQELGASDPE